MKCECEHKSHFDSGAAHAYGKAKGMTIRTTAYGTFALCRECLAANHLS